ncbi:hypothetical protein BV924_17810 [Pectobacterium odoriferum]|uniref:Uncharacterized protein n=1 Tax=Pectobacterium odoriferum TaxID=78398 RepID=A0ABD6VKT9_9GAMM|nr:hypothetical protein BCS7_18475 [Pectobacterium odoriferum]KGA37313.1 hypothetical protein KS43_07550 [Pectobacterium odoriferum]POD93098.1 hypothetical protein BVY06_18635 [Pectobacterium odoriferum]POD98720.1 hypothetical protein BVY05_20025 [Pectobacterium odoriferum]POE00002.1 hypothetical protein BV916_20685 [Pectobacterium odoriferum]
MAVLLPIMQLITTLYARFSSGFAFINLAFLERTKAKFIVGGIRENIQIRFSDLFLYAVFG